MAKFAITIALILGLFFTENSGFHGKNEMNAGDNFVWRGRKLLERGDPMRNRARLVSRTTCPTVACPTTQCPTCVCPKPPTTTQRLTVACPTTQCPTCVCPTTPTTTKCPTCTCPTTPTTTQSPTCTCPTTTTTTQWQSSSEKANQTTTPNPQTISVSTPSFDNMTTSGSTAAPIQITINNTQVNVTNSMFVTTDTPTTMKKKPTAQTSQESCVDNGIDNDKDPDELLLIGCNLVCRGLGFCFCPSEVIEMLPEICVTWLHVYCANSSASYIDCLLKYLPISGFICPGEESQEVQRIGICRNCTNLCLANTFSRDLTKKDSCDEGCRNKHSCVKLTASQKKKNLTKLSKGCRKCLKNECGDDGNARFKRDCDYYAIIGECQEECSDIYACDFCFTC